MLPLNFMKNFEVMLAKGRRLTVAEELSAKLGTEVTVTHDGDGKCTLTVRNEVEGCAATVQNFLKDVIKDPYSEA